MICNLLFIREIIIIIIFCNEFTNHQNSVNKPTDTEDRHVASEQCFMGLSDKANKEGKEKNQEKERTSQQAPKLVWGQSSLSATEIKWDKWNDTIRWVDKISRLTRTRDLKETHRRPWCQWPCDPGCRWLQRDCWAWPSKPCQSPPHQASYDDRLQCPTTDLQQQGNRKYRCPPPVCCCPLLGQFVYMQICAAPSESLLEFMPLMYRPVLAITCKHDIINKIWNIYVTYCNISKQGNPYKANHSHTEHWCNPKLEISTKQFSATAFSSDVCQFCDICPTAVKFAGLQDKWSLCRMSNPSETLSS